MGTIIVLLVIFAIYDAIREQSAPYMTVEQLKHELRLHENDVLIGGEL